MRDRRAVGVAQAGLAFDADHGVARVVPVDAVDVVVVIGERDGQGVLQRGIETERLTRGGRELKPPRYRSPGEVADVREFEAGNAVPVAAAIERADRA